MDGRKNPATRPVKPQEMFREKFMRIMIRLTQISRIFSDCHNRPCRQIGLHLLPPLSALGRLSLGSPSQGQEIDGEAGAIPARYRHCDSELREQIGQPESQPKGIFQPSAT
jgi:hypothetical protein